MSKKIKDALKAGATVHTVTAANTPGAMPMTDKLRNSKAGALIVEAFRDGLQAAAKVDNARARLAIGFFDAIKAGEITLAEMDLYMRKQTAQSIKDDASKFLTSLLSMYCPPYNAAVDAIEHGKRAKEDDALIAVDAARRTVKSATQLVRVALSVAYLAIKHYNAQGMLLSTSGGLRFDRVNGTDSGVTAAVSAFEREANEKYPKKAGGNGTAQGQGTEEPAKIKLHDAVQAIERFAGIEAKDLSKSNREQLQHALVILMGVFGGVEKVATIYAKDADAKAA